MFGSLGRRAVLRAGCLGLAGDVAGCLDAFTGGQTLSPPPFGPLGTDWPMAGRDPENTGSSPAATGPERTPTVEWSIQPSHTDAPHVAVTGELLVVVGDDSVRAFDLAASERRWSAPVDGSVPVAVGSSACYLAAEPARLQALDRADGTGRVLVEAAGPLGPPALADGTLYVGDETGLVRAVDTADGSTQWSVSIGDRVRGRVATDGSHVAATAESRIVVLDAVDGEISWEASLPCCTPAPPVLADGVVYTLRHVLRARDAASGDELWVYEPENAAPAGPTLAGDHVYLGQLWVDAVGRSGGDHRWRGDVGGRSLVARPVSGSSTVFTAVGDRANRVVALDAADGTPGWSIQVGESPVAQLALAGDRLLAGTTGGSLYSLRGAESTD